MTCKHPDQIEHLCECGRYAETQLPLFPSVYEMDYSKGPHIIQNTADGPGIVLGPKPLVDCETIV